MRLERTIYRQRDVLATGELHPPFQDGSDGQPLRKVPQPLSLDRVRNTTQVCYRSPLALRLAGPWQRNPLELAGDLAQTWQVDLQETDLPVGLATLLSHCQLEVKPPGWLVWTVTEAGLADWLQHLVNAPLPEPVACMGSVPPEASLFALQATHGRCWRWVRLVQEQSGLPDREGGGNNGLLSFSHPSEWALMAQLIDLIDLLASPSTPLDCRVCLQQAERLHQQFQQFDRDCRPLPEGPTKRSGLPGRLGLVISTQRLLHWVLTACLKVPAPVEL